jgi:hypothetical protein
MLCFHLTFLFTSRILLLREKAYGADITDTKEQSRIVRQALEALDFRPGSEWDIGGSTSFHDTADADA